MILDDLNGVKNPNEDISVCLFVDTAGCDCEEVIGDDGVSKANPEEAKVNHLTLFSLFSCQ